MDVKVVDEAKVELKNGAPFYTQGDVSFPFIKDSLSDTLRGLYATDLEAFRKLAKSNGFEVHDVLGIEHLKPVVAGCVQNFWYEKVQNKLPAGVTKNHDNRCNTYWSVLRQAKENPDAFKKKSEATSTKRVGKSPGAPRSGKLWAVDEGTAASYENGKPAVDCLKGQPQLVITCMQGIKGPASLKQITEAVVKTGKLATRQPAERVVAFYLNQFRHHGLIYEAAGSAPTTHAAEPAAEAPTGEEKKGDGSSKAAQEPPVAEGKGKAKKGKKS